MPSDVTAEVSAFDRFAKVAARFFSKPWFFALCVLVVLVWAPSYFFIRSVDTWQLIINTATTIVTFLMVALLQNTQSRADQSTQDKLNAIARYLPETEFKALYEADSVRNAEAVKKAGITQ